MSASAVTVTTREAFHACPALVRLYTYEQVMAIDAIRIGLENTARAMTEVRRLKPENFTLEPA